MDVHQESLYSDDMSPVLGIVEKRSVHQFPLQAIDTNNLPIESTNVASTNLNEHVNDDCLREIFLVKSLTLMDLCSIAETCTRFQQISGSVFPTKMAICIRYLEISVTAGNNFSSRERAIDIERILMNFGSFLSAITIDSVDDSCENSTNFVFNLVTEFCSDNLESLEIKNLTIPKHLIIKLRPVFKRLQRLNIVDCVVPDDKTLFADLDSLVELKVVNVDNCSAILENIFPKLERLILDDSGHLKHNIITSKIFSTFISRHTNLKTIDIVAWHLDEEDKLTIPQVIGNSCKLLENLAIDQAPGYMDTSLLQPMTALNSLKSCILCSFTCEDLGFCSAMTKLRELHLWHCILPKDLNQFSYLAHLSKLHFYLEDNNVIDIVDIIHRLRNLDELTVCGIHAKSSAFVLDKKTFYRIVNIVKDRPKSLTLKCKFNFDSKNCAENQKVRLNQFEFRVPYY